MHILPHPHRPHWQESDAALWGALAGGVSGERGLRGAQQSGASGGASRDGTGGARRGQEPGWDDACTPTTCLDRHSHARRTAHARTEPHGLPAQSARPRLPIEAPSVHGRARCCRPSRSTPPSAGSSPPPGARTSSRRSSRTSRREARAAGLWNLFLPDSSDPAHGLTVLDYAPLAELSGWSPELAPEAMNCAAPDTGNMEILHMFGTPEQKEQLARPAAGRRDPLGLLDDRAGGRQQRRPQHPRPRIRREGDEYVVNGRKWWTTGADDPRCRVLVVMGRTDPDGRRLPPAVDGARPDRRARRDASCATSPCSATTTSTGTRRSPSPTSGSR